MTMYRVTMTVHHGVTHSEVGEGRFIPDALTELFGTALGIGYGPTGNANRAALLIRLARHGEAQHGWADYRVEVTS